MKTIVALIVSCVLCAYAVQQPSPPSCPGPNEVFFPCKNNCTKDTCDSVAMPISCISFLPCTGGCLCEPGYFRKNTTSDCLPVSNCFI